MNTGFSNIYFDQNILAHFFILFFEQEQRGNMLEEDNAKLTNDLSELRGEQNQFHDAARELEDMRTRLRNQADDVQRYRKMWEEERNQNKQVR